MKVKIQTAFNDKYTGKLYKVGEEIEITVERANEILKVGNFIEIVDEKAEKNPEIVDEKAEATKKAKTRRKLTEND